MFDAIDVWLYYSCRWLIQLVDKRNEERDHISDVIRQEFADKIVFNLILFCTQ